MGAVGLPGAAPAAVSDDAQLKRLRWRCRRGMRELDQLMLRYLDRQWAQDSDAQRGVFLQLLDCEDDKLWRWFMGYDTPDDVQIATLVQRIRQLPP
ncbi:antitoxin CptB [Luteimonas cucumeris]|uniref:FAD assembly factor SdhE n=1 Tax=Luteimonas cucumeris TaxID=985012 RepID=A0A562LA49_9GAMM|nr:antitoxin CptB [Luteimonas cucumeris]